MRADALKWRIHYACRKIKSKSLTITESCLNAPRSFRIDNKNIWWFSYNRVNDTFNGGVRCETMAHWVLYVIVCLCTWASATIGRSGRHRVRHDNKIWIIPITDAHETWASAVATTRAFFPDNSNLIIIMSRSVRLRTAPHCPPAHTSFHADGARVLYSPFFT